MIKATVLLFLQSHGPPRTVNRTPYRVGLVAKVHAIKCDGVLLSGLFVLGGKFWEKLRSVFVHEACVVTRPVALASGPEP